MSERQLFFLTHAIPLRFESFAADSEPCEVPRLVDRGGILNFLLDLLLPASSLRHLELVGQSCHPETIDDDEVITSRMSTSCRDPPTHEPAFWFFVVGVKVGIDAGAVLWIVTRIVLADRRFEARHVGVGSPHEPR